MGNAILDAMMPAAVRLLLVCALPAMIAAHSATTIPEPRNAIDSDHAPWSGAVPHPLPFEPWCPIPSKHAVGKDDRNISGSNGQACFWFSNGCAIGCDKCDGSTRGPIPVFACNQTDCVATKSAFPFGPKASVCTAAQGSMNATICDPAQRTVNTAAKCGSPEDFYFYSPWRAPGYAPVIDSCGSAGGRLPGQGAGGYGAEYVNTTHAKIGDLGSVSLPGRDTGVTWEAGAMYQVAWTSQANHGGGYSYRLCPESSSLNEDCFNRAPLKMVGKSSLRWGGVGGRVLEYDPVDVTQGTKAGVHWRKNPIPRAWKTKTGEWGQGSNHNQSGIGFQPVCDDDGMDRQGLTQSCTGEWGPYNLEIMDHVMIPSNLNAGKWVLNWRLDCEESNQIWQSCSDVAITKASPIQE